MSLRRAAIYLGALTALIAIIGDWSADPTLALLWRFPAALLLAALAYESVLVARTDLAVEIDAPGAWFLGRPGAARFVFHNRLRRGVLIEFAPNAPASFSFDSRVSRVWVAPSGAAHLNFTGTPRSLGTHAWPEMRARIAGPLGFAWWPRQLRTVSSVRVQPELLAEAARHAGDGKLGARTGQDLGAGVEVLQLRAYQPGDPPRVIDWKATARVRRLVSRDFSEDQHLEILILIDAGRSSALRSGGLDRFGHYVNVAARLAQYAVTQGDSVGLVVFADRPLLELAPAQGATAVARIRKLLGAACVQDTESDPLQAAIRVRSLARKRSLVVILTDLDDAVVAGQLAATVRLLSPKHLTLVAGLSSDAAEALAQAPARRWLDPYRALAAQEYCESLARKVQSLRTLGAPALAAKPDQLESAVFHAYGRLRRQRRV